MKYFNYILLDIRKNYSGVIIINTCYIHPSATAQCHYTPPHSLKNTIHKTQCMYIYAHAHHAHHLIHRENSRTDLVSHAPRRPRRRECALHSTPLRTEQRLLSLFTSPPFLVQSATRPVRYSSFSFSSSSCTRWSYSSCSFLQL